VVVPAISPSAAPQPPKSGCRRRPVRDRLGHVRGLMNTSKTITDRYVYDAYGNDMVPNLHNTTEGNALRFRWNGSYGYRTLYLLSGQQTTNTAALAGQQSTNTATVPDLLGTGMHVGARHYSPSLRRWLQRDPAGLGGGSPNLYQYCGCNPVGAADPSGLGPGDQLPVELRKTILRVQELNSKRKLTEVQAFATILQAIAFESLVEIRFCGFSIGTSFDVGKFSDLLYRTFVANGGLVSAAGPDAVELLPDDSWRFRTNGGEGTPRHFAAAAYVAWLALGDPLKAKALGLAFEAIGGWKPNDSPGDVAANNLGADFLMLLARRAFSCPSQVYDWVIDRMAQPRR